MKIVIIGAGPVGTLAALYAAERNHEVEIYEFRDDLSIPAVIPLNFTKSINLTLSQRGLNALSHACAAGLLEEVLRNTVPVSARMVHGESMIRGLTSNTLKYDVHGGVGAPFFRQLRNLTNARVLQVLSVVDRGQLNERLLLELKRYKNVKVFFNHKLLSAKLDQQVATFEKQTHVHPQAGQIERAREEISVNFDLMIGADGAHSATRYQLGKYARLDMSQSWLDIFWCEFKITATKQGRHRLDPSHLHIWPQKEFMFIALPDLEGTFTCNLFASEAIFHELETRTENLISFFTKNFPGLVPNLIDPVSLASQFLKNPHQPLVMFRCNKYHYSNSCVILGDAAHVMVPFYGQGLNTGFEDVRILFEDFLDNIPITPKDGRSSMASALAAYSEARVPDVHIITDLALRNYEEMRTGVTSYSYFMRNWIEQTLSVRAPSLGWATLYRRVAFTDMRYTDVKSRFEHQRRVLQSLAVFGAILILLFSWWFTVYLSIAWTRWPGTLEESRWRAWSLEI